MIEIIDSTQDAYAPIVITDASGNLKFIKLEYSGKQLTPDPTFAGFSGVRIGDTVTKSVVVRSSNSFLIKKVEVAHAETFTLSYQKSLPYLLTPGDSFEAAISFKPSDTILASAYIQYSNECMMLEQAFTAQGATGLIMAEDKDFGVIAEGSSRCHDIRIENKGSASFSLLPGASIMGGTEFTIDSVDLMQLPLLLNPGTFAEIKVCYTPHDESADTATIEWPTDLSEAYANSIKPTSTLTAKAVKQAVHSLRDQAGILIKPNPTSGKFTLDLQGIKDDEVTIIVYNPLGKECYRTKAFGGGPVELQLSQPSAGSYIVTVESDDKSYDLLLIVQ
jgi:hypothetical protein